MNTTNPRLSSYDITLNPNVENCMIFFFFWKMFFVITFVDPFLSRLRFTMSRFLVLATSTGMILSGLILPLDTVSNALLFERIILIFGGIVGVISSLITFFLSCGKSSRVLLNTTFNFFISLSMVTYLCSVFAVFYGIYFLLYNLHWFFCDRYIDDAYNFLSCPEDSDSNVQEEYLIVREKSRLILTVIILNLVFALLTRLFMKYGISPSDFRRNRQVCALSSSCLHSIIIYLLDWWLCWTVNYFLLQSSILFELHRLPSF